ncbi:hypothetical protein, partial [Streptomyces sp. NPDC003832]
MTRRDEHDQRYADADTDKPLPRDRQDQLATADPSDDPLALPLTVDRAKEAGPVPQTVEVLGFASRRCTGDAPPTTSSWAAATACTTTAPPRSGRTAGLLQGVG